MRIPSDRADLTCDGRIDQAVATSSLMMCQLAHHDHRIGEASRARPAGTRPRRARIASRSADRAPQADVACGTCGHMPVNGRELAGGSKLFKLFGGRGLCEQACRDACSKTAIILPPRRRNSTPGENSSASTPRLFPSSWRRRKRAPRAPPNPSNDTVLRGSSLTHHRLRKVRRSVETRSRTGWCGAAALRRIESAMQFAARRGSRCVGSS